MEIIKAIRNHKNNAKSDKQFDRDITRPSNTKPKTKDSSSDHPSSRTRSKKENLRCDDFSYAYDFKQSLLDGVASPESCIGSDTTCKSPDVQCYSPESLEYVKMETQMSSLTDSHRVDPVPEAYRWMDSIPVQNVNLTSFEDCCEFPSDIEIVNGCLSSEVQRSTFMFCDTITQLISISDSVEFHEHHGVDSIPDMMQDDHCLSELSGSDPIIESYVRQIRAALGRIKFCLHP